MKVIGIFLVFLLVVVGAICIIAHNDGHKLPLKATDKTMQLARMIERDLNSGDYHGCQCSATKDYVTCTLSFEIGTDANQIIATVSEVANYYAQIGAFCPIYFFGTRGKQIVCSFLYWPGIAGIERKI
jgi:hypothetical protein